MKEDDFSLSRLGQFEEKRRPLVNFQEATNARTMSMELSSTRVGVWLRNRSFRVIAQLLHTREYQEIITGLRPPTRGETFRLITRSLLP